MTEITSAEAATLTGAGYGPDGTSLFDDALHLEQLLAKTPADRSAITGTLAAGSGVTEILNDMDHAPEGVYASDHQYGFYTDAELAALPTPPPIVITP